jgi:hypothetical protein
MANFLPPAIIEIKAIADKAIAEFKQVNNELEKMEGAGGKASAGIGNMEKASKLATGALLGLGAAFAGFAALGIKEATDAEVVMTKLGATMSAAGLNTKANRDAVRELTSSYIDLGFADDQAAAGLEILMRATGDLNESQKLLALSADLARTKNIGLSEASSILAKASMGNAKAFKEMGITLDTTLPKSEAIAKAMDELNAKIGSQAENATKTFAVQMQIVKERFNDTAESLGTMLLPLIKDLLDRINKGVEFIKKHSEAFKILAGVFLTITVALAAYNATVKIQMALTKAWTVITTVQKTVTALLTGQQIALNTAMKLNPIGLVVSAAMLLVGAFVLLWNKSETFRKGVITMAKAALNAFAAIVPMVGQVGEAILKMVLSPLKSVLTLLSKLPGVGKFAKAGLDFLNKGLDGVSDFADKASKKAKDLAANLDKLNKPIKLNIGGGKDALDVGGNTKGGTGTKGKTPEEIKAAKEKADAIKKENEEAMKIVAQLNDKLADAQKKFTDKMADIDKACNEKVASLREAARKKIEKLDKDFAEKRAKLEKDTQDKITAAQTKFNDTMASLNKKKADDLAKLALDNQNKIAEITKAGQDKLASIVKQSVDRLRSAFAQGTSFSVGDIFKNLAETGAQSAEGLLDALKTKLAGARKLAENASMLASKGFSQTFIEQVVSQGPEVGNKLAESLQNATPETISELQATYLAMENTTNNGLTQLAEAMNSGARLATDELREAYQQAQIDTAEALKEQQKLYSDSQAEIMNTFNSAMAEAEKERDETIATLRKDLQEALADLQKDYNDSLAEINRDLADSLAEAFKDMQDAQDEAKKQLIDALAEIEKEFEEKLSNIQSYVEATIAAINALKAAMASVGSTGGGTNPTTPTTTPKTNTPNIIPIPNYNPYQNRDRDYDAHLRNQVVVNAPITNYNTTSTEDISQSIVRISKYGMTVI